MWVPDHRGFTENDGPYFWIHLNYACPNCHTNKNDYCCQNVPEGQFCHADSVDIADDPNVNYIYIISKTVSHCNLFCFIG